MPNLPYTTAAAPRGPAPKFQSALVEAKTSQFDSTAFNTMIDALNPLQQIPGVGQAYRKMTGDKSSNGAQLAGHVAIGAAVAGPIGMAVGAGVFLLEKALPGVFTTIGKLFSSGKNSDSPADMPAIIGEQKRSVAAPRRPLIEGLDNRPGTRPARSPLQTPLQVTPNMSMAQFDALMQSIGAQPIEASKSLGGKSSGNTTDVAALIQINLDKYQRAQQQTGAR